MVNNNNGQVRLIFMIPSRGLIGYTTEFMTLTHGYGIINHTYDSYQPKLEGNIGGRRQGVLVAMEDGKSTPYSIMQLEDRGTIFVEPGTEVYEGMIVGEHTRENDLPVNITREKHITNMRSATKDQTTTLKQTRTLTLEEALEYLNEDEYCEVTPKSIRLRKKILEKSLREKIERKKKYAESDQ